MQYRYFSPGWKTSGVEYAALIRSASLCGLSESKSGDYRTSPPVCVNKWRTEVGDGAFVGSGSMLVAPVKVGPNANTGAGSTITKDAPEGKLTLARARQVTIEGWKRPQKKT